MEGVRHHWGGGERKEIAEERDSQAPTQERLCKDCQAAHWKINISPANILWPSCVSGLVTSRILFGNELCLLLRLLAEEREDIFDYELHAADHVEPWKQCTCSSVLTNGKCLLYWGCVCLVRNKIQSSIIHPSPGSSRDMIQGRSTFP